MCYCSLRKQATCSRNSTQQPGICPQHGCGRLNCSYGYPVAASAVACSDACGGVCPCVQMSTDDGVSYCNRKITKLKATLDESERVGRQPGALQQPWQGGAAGVYRCWLAVLA
jgi:hypothetical protein